uniref:Calcineurin-like phosphoesterase domain-containing protein n=1 Tax=Opuntia streptacantha TaxID=393608 RepID=A0A7C9A694_OPUST
MVMREKSWKLTLFFCLIWALTLLYGEMFAYWVPFLQTCSWPNLRHPSDSSLKNLRGHPNDFVKLAVIADPQLMDRTSHDLPPLALEIAQFYTDLHMRRAFLSAILPFKPDVILFLGDYFDGGPQLSNKEWQESLNRFKHIFDLGRERMKDIPVYYIPGNHDIGYAGRLTRMPKVVKRYETYFGARNHRFTAGKVDFIAIDAQTVDGDPQDTLTASTWNFVNNVSSDGQANPRVLLTHIPLYRPDWTFCGPFRSSEVINQRVARSRYDQGIVYQNYVTEGSSKRLLDLIKPVLVLSGHDHDQCTVTHETQYGTVKEHTVGTVSWQQGNWYPSFMLLSVGNFAQDQASSLDPVVLVHLCFLPTQLFIYIWYIILFVVTILALALWPTHGLDIGHRFNHFITNIKNLVRESVTKEKTEDEDCEYEMMWDAEGGMHLVKKPQKVPSTSSKEMSSIERGNAVMRAARRQMLQEQEASLKADSKGNHAPSSITKASLRSGKSLGRAVLGRCLQVLGMTFVIAVVNVPLYMMLLFKDWVAQ